MSIGTRIFCSSIALATVLGCAQFAQAVAIVGSMQEAFDYPAGTNFPNTSTLNGGTGWNPTGSAAAANDAGANWGSILNAGTVRNATSPGLNFTSTSYFPGSGTKLTLDGTGAGQNIGRTLGGQTINEGTTYISLLMSRNNDTIRTINFALFDGTTERMAVGQIGAGGGSTGGNFGLLMNNSNPGGLLQTTGTPIAMGTGVTHLVVLRIDWSTSGFETVNLWVDPASVASEAAMGAPYITTNAFELTQITGIRPFVGASAAVPTGGPTVPGSSANFDEIRFGGTFQSVTQAGQRAGDVDGDGDVDMTDFNPIRDNFQKTVTLRTQGDLNADGKVNFKDFRQWKTAFPFPVEAGALGIPEPTTACLGLTVLACIGAMRRSSRRTA
jgi:hypothetical protein